MCQLDFFFLTYLRGLLWFQFSSDGRIVIKKLFLCSAGLGLQSTRVLLWLHIQKVLFSESSHHSLTSHPEPHLKISSPVMRYLSVFSTGWLTENYVEKLVEVRRAANISFYIKELTIQLSLYTQAVYLPKMELQDILYTVSSKKLSLVYLQPRVVGFFQFNSSPQPPGYITYLSSALQALKRGKNISYITKAQSQKMRFRLEGTVLGDLGCLFAHFFGHFTKCT